MGSDLGLTDLDAVLSTLAVRNLVHSVGAVITDDATVLVAGAGLAVAVEALATEQRQILAVDSSMAVLETLVPSSNVTTATSGLDPIDAQDHALGAVLLIDALPTSDREATERLLAEVERVLDPAGVVVVTVASTDPGADLLRHQVASRWEHLAVWRQVDLGGFALLADPPAPEGDGVALSVVAGHPLSGAVRWVYAAAHRSLPLVTPTAHVTPGVPTGLSTGMHELLTERLVSDRRRSELEAALGHLRDVQRHLVEAEQAAGRSRELEAALSDSRARIEELHSMIDTILRSTSWKVTEPVRRAGGVARTMSNKLALDTVRDTMRKYRQG